MGDYPPQYYSPRARKYYRKRPSVAGGGGGGASVGGWVELGRTTLGSDTANIDVTGLANKRYLMVLSNFNSATSSGNPYIRINGDTGSNYSMRYSRNGGADGTSTSASAGIFIGNVVNTDLPFFMVDYIANYSSKEKLLLHHMINQNTAGAGTAPNRSEVVGKWSNTSDAIDEVNINGNGVNISSGGECVVLGYDPTDTHSTDDNFWQELGSADVSSGTIDISFTAKKYLWLQCYAINSGSGGDHLNLRLGNTSLDSGSNYCQRYSIDGSTDGTLTSQSDINLFMSPTSNEKMFVNVFIINNASNEKLMIIHGVSDNALTGSNNSPSRFECVAKWTNSSSQANILQLFNQGAGTLAENSTARIWGAD